MKIDDKDDKPNTGRIHVDYAQARDDLYEWECKQRSLAREMRHRSRLEEERLRPPSPPPIIHYSDHEASMLMEKLKGWCLPVLCGSTRMQNDGCLLTTVAEQKLCLLQRTIPS